MSEHVKWTKERDLICFSVVSAGKTGAEWFALFQAMGYRVGDCAKNILLKKLVSTDGLEYQIAIISDASKVDCTTASIRRDASRRGFINPDVEIACLIREMFTDEDIKAMGFDTLVIMHDPIKDSNNDLSLLYVCSDNWLDVSRGCPDYSWGWDHKIHGFVFVNPCHKN